MSSSSAERCWGRWGWAGERVIDIGTGPGLLAAEIAAAVGPDGLVCGIDISDSMLALARARATRPSSAPMGFRQAGWEQHLVDPHLPRTLRGSLERAGFQVAPPQVVPLCNVGFANST
jgi:2-polyprenyl-3-methyl-5-hydroxy-6-metoxy-1,4-benzoquinol methylase